jgi:hypothetical protein
MRSPEGYATVFGDDVSLEVWPAITEVLKRAEEALESLRPRNSKERFLARSRNLLGLLAVARLLGKFSYSVDELVALDKSQLTPALFVEMWKPVQQARAETGYTHDDHIPSANLVCAKAAKQFGLTGVEQVGRRILPGGPKRPGRSAKIAALDETFIEQVNEKLPPQPWRQGTHSEVAKQLNVKPSKVHDAIQVLIARGTRMEQRDGVVYDKNGQVVTADKERADQLQTPTDTKPRTD